MARILLAEDDDSVRAFVCRALQLDGHDVVEAVDGLQGMERLDEMNGQVEILLSDIQMPGMDGIELAKLTAAKYPQTKIVLITGFADQRERADFLSRIIRDVVLKPFTLAEIRHRIAAVLGAARDGSPRVA